MEALDPEELRRFLESQEVVGGGLTFGDVQRQFDEMERLGIIPAGQRSGRIPDSGASAGVTQPEEAERPPILPIYISPDGVEESFQERADRLAREAAEGEDTEAEDTEAEDPALVFAREQTAQRRQNAFSLIETFLTKAGLTGLEKNVRELLGQGIEDSESILFRLRDTEQFRTRFKANTARVKQGLPELDPATYIGMEQSYRETLIANNFDKGFYDDQDDFAKLIEGNVSLAEFQARINEGYRKVADADPEVIRQMEQLYGVGKSELAEYFIDPQRTRPLLTSKELQRQAQAAQVAARGRELAGLQLTATSAEDLIARGFSPEEAQQAFTRQGQLSGLYQEMGGEEMLSEQEKLGATFGFDLTAQEKLERRKAQRVGEFQAGGQFARTTGATSGAIETGLGTAQ
jgi:hypothetical protein